MHVRLLLATAALALLGLAAPASAADADVALLDCETQAFDAQGDGAEEPWTQCSTPPCGCDCPYVGAGLVVEAADQQFGAAAVTSGCQTAYAYSAGPADGGFPATVWPIVGGGGLGDPIG